jgi:hypothetical protein
VSSSLAWCVVAALGSAVAYAVSSVSQHRAASRSSTGAKVEVSGLLRLATQPLWLAGIGADLIGLAAHVTALRLGPVTLVQPLQVTGLLFAIPIGAVMAGRRVQADDLASAALVVAGLGLFLTLGHLGPATQVLPAATSTVLTVAALILVMALCAAGRHRAASTHAVMLAGAAGVAFAVTAVLLEALGQVQAARSWSALLTAEQIPAVAGLLLLGTAGFVVSQAAFQVGALELALPTLTVVDPVVSVALAAVLLHESLRVNIITVPGFALAVALVLVGVVRLGRGQAAADQPGGPSWRGLLTAGRNRAGAAGVGAVYGLTAGMLPILIALHRDPDTNRAERALLVLAAAGTGAVLGLARAARQSQQNPRAAHRQPPGPGHGGAAK